MLSTALKRGLSVKGGDGGRGSRRGSSRKESLVIGAVNITQQRRSLAPSHPGVLWTEFSRGPASRRLLAASVPFMSLS